MADHPHNHFKYTYSNEKGMEYYEESIMYIGR